MSEPPDVPPMTSPASPASLADAHAELEHLYQTAPVGLCYMDRDLRFLRVNERLAAINGKSVSSHIGRTLHQVIPEIAATVESAYRRVLETAEPVIGREVDGSTAAWSGTALVSYYPVFADDGSVCGVSTIVQDITERKRTERMWAGSCRAMERLISGEGLTATLEELARMSEQVGGPGVQCAILLLDGEERLRPGAAPSLPRPYLDAIDGLPIGPAAGSCGTAAYRRERVVVEDVECDPLWESLRGVALRFGLRACWSEPLLGEERGVLGTLALYADRATGPTAAQLNLLERVSQLARMAITHSRDMETLRAGTPAPGGD